MIRMSWVPLEGGALTNLEEKMSKSTLKQPIELMDAEIDAVAGGVIVHIPVCPRSEAASTFGPIDERRSGCFVITPNETGPTPA